MQVTSSTMSQLPNTAQLYGSCSSSSTSSPSACSPFPSSVQGQTQDPKNLSLLQQSLTQLLQVLQCVLGMFFQLFGIPQNATTTPTNAALPVRNFYEPLAPSATTPQALATGVTPSSSSLSTLVSGAGNWLWNLAKGWLGCGGQASPTATSTVSGASPLLEGICSFGKQLWNGVSSGLSTAAGFVGSLFGL
jgi:hypothetical protein